MKLAVIIKQIHLLLIISSNNRLACQICKHYIGPVNREKFSMRTIVDLILFSRDKKKIYEGLQAI